MKEKKQHENNILEHFKIRNSCSMFKYFIMFLSYWYYIQEFLFYAYNKFNY